MADAEGETPKSEEHETVNTKEQSRDAFNEFIEVGDFDTLSPGLYTESLDFLCATNTFSAPR